MYFTGQVMPIDVSLLDLGPASHDQLDQVTDLEELVAFAARSPEK